jgi:hypothetical protein
VSVIAMVFMIIIIVIVVIVATILSKRPYRPLNNLVKFAAIEPYSAALWAVIDLNSLSI